MGASEIGEGYEPRDEGAEFLASLVRGTQPAPEPILAYDEAPDQLTDDVSGQMMAEAERRLAKANLYRTVLQSPLFEGGSDPVLMAEVEKEFSTFARERLAELLGVATRPVTTGEQPFTPTQVVILRTLADAVVSNRKISSSLGVTATEKPQPAAAPKLTRRTVAPAPAKRTQVVQQAPAPFQQAAKPQPPAPVQQRRNPNAIPAHESIVSKAGVRHKIIWVNVDADEYGSAGESIILGLQPGQKQQLPNGVVVFMPEDGSGPYKLVERKITSQARTGKSVPFPPSSAMAALTAMQSGQAEQTALAGNPGLMTAVGVAKNS